MKYLYVLALTWLSSTAAIACPNYSLSAAAQYGGSGSFFYQPRSYSIIAGGSTNIDYCGGVPGTGHFMDRPDFRFDTYQMAGYSLHLRVNSRCDAALLVNTSTGSWIFDDDSNGNLDPLIILPNPVDGYIDVWVGTFDGQYCDAVLELETF